MKNKRAFTLAETLITLLVIGVVAALTIPVLMQQINERALLKQRQTAAAKIAEGFANMRVNGDLETKYASTAEFVEAMKKYFQITQVCNSNNLSACFAETVTSTENGEQNVSEMADVEKVMGLKLADGTSMLIKYNTEAAGIPEGASSESYRATISGDTVSAATFGLFQYVFDVNGAKSPNTKGKDMLGDLVVAKGLNDPYGLGFEVINNTLYSPDTYCSGGSSNWDGYWTCASDYCASLGGSLPDDGQLMTIADKLSYGNCESIEGTTYCHPDTSSDLWALVGNYTLLSSSRGAGRRYRDYNHDYFGGDPTGPEVKVMCVK